MPKKNILDKNSQESAKKYLVKTYMYKIAGYMFAFVGMLLAANFYTNHIGNDVMNFIHKPFIVSLMIIPFLPAFILIMMSRKSREKASVLLYQDDKSKAPDPKQKA